MFNFIMGFITCIAVEFVAIIIAAIVFSVKENKNVKE